MKNSITLLKKHYLFLAMFFYFSIVFSQSAGFNTTYVVLSINGGGNTFYDLQASTPNPDFNGANLGSFCQGATSGIVFKGAEHNNYKCGGCDITSTRLFYRIYPTATPSGSFVNNNIGFTSDFANGCGGRDQKWSSTAYNTNLLAGLPGGNYTLEVFSEQSTSCSGLQYASNGGANYKATFTVNPSPTMGTVSATPACDGGTSTVSMTGFLPSTTGLLNCSIAHPSFPAPGFIPFQRTATSDALGNFSFQTDPLPLALNGAVVTIHSGTAVATGCSANFIGKTVTIVVNANVTYYQDADADGFGNPAVNQVTCTGAPVGYVSNNLDCNDAQTYYTDTDGDGFGVLPTLACGTVTNNTDCDDTKILHLDADGDGYGSSTHVACGGVELSGDCVDINPLINPGVAEICYDGIDNDCDGTIDDGCTPIVSVIQSTQCGETLPAINSYIYANLVSGAQGYRFRVTDLTTNQVQTIDKALRVFTLTQLPNYAFDRAYQIEVAIRYNNVWQPTYGAACFVTTPATTTQIQSSQCSATLTTMNEVIFADNVPFAAGYRFRITDVVTSTQSIIDRPIRDIRLTNLPSPQYNTTYSIEVAVRNTNGTYLPYGTVCNVTSPSFPTTQVQISQCDLATTLPLTTTLFADSFSGATMYRFRFVSGATTIQVDRPIRSIYLASVPGIQAGTAYSVSVALQINGTFGPFGKVCLVTTAGGARETEVVKTVSSFNAVAYPNPYLDNFKLNVTTSLDTSIQVRVYDMLGKQVENRTVDTAVINEVEIGEIFPTGVYNVIVTQGSDVKTLRVIKR